MRRMWIIYFKLSDSSKMLESSSRKAGMGRGPWSSALKAFFIAWLRGGRKNCFECIWRICPSIVIWEIWKERNRRIFQDKSETTEQLLNRIDHSIEEVVNAAVFKKNLSNCVLMDSDRAIQNRWLGIKIGKAGDTQLANSKAKKREEVKWEAPEIGWLKVNFDGASRGNPGNSGAGCIVRDNQGDLVAYGALSLKDGTNNEAKFQATLLALKCLKRCGGRKIILEGDSMVVVQAMSKTLIHA